MAKLDLTEKGIMALNYVNKFYADGTEFCAADLSEKAGEKVSAQSLGALVSRSYLERLGGSPVMFKTVEGFSELFGVLREELTQRTQTKENLDKAKKAKDDEFYTFYDDIENEVMKYRKQFKGKVVYLPCDDPLLNNNTGSEFWNFFEANFMNFGLKKLIATHYSEDGDAYKIWIENDVNDDGYIDGDDVLQEDLKGNGDFRSPECCEILKECDIVVTNPPFSMFRDFVDWIITADKDFLIIGRETCYGYKEIFPLIKSNRMKIGYNAVKKFKRPDGSVKEFGNIHWVTTLNINKSNNNLIMTEKYNEFDYPKYDNYDAIEVCPVKKMPKDYDGVMGVPISFMNKMNPEQFEIVGFRKGNDKKDLTYKDPTTGEQIYPFTRILIKKR